MFLSIFVLYASSSVGYISKDGFWQSPITEADHQELFHSGAVGSMKGMPPIVWDVSVENYCYYNNLIFGELMNPNSTLT